MSARHAAGVRATWSEMPHPIRRWVAHLLGSRIVDVAEQTGGMSPGCASRLVGQDGARLFVKVVGRLHNPDTPTLFRREVTALDLIGSADLWADLVAVWDDDDWVAIVLEDVEGRHPDLTRDPDLAAVLTATDALVDELARRVPEPPEPQPSGGLGDLHRAFARWGAAVDRLPEIDPDAPPALAAGPRERGPRSGRGPGRADRAAAGACRHPGGQPADPVHRRARLPRLGHGGGGAGLGRSAHGAPRPGGGTGVRLCRGVPAHCLPTPATTR